MHERYPHLVSFSLLVGKLSLVVLRWSGLPDSASREEARTRMQRFAFALGRGGLRLNEIGFGRRPLYVGIDVARPHKLCCYTTDSQGRPTFIDTTD